MGRLAPRNCIRRRPESGAIYRDGWEPHLNLWRVPIEESSGRVLGQPVPVTSGSTPIDNASISSDGQRVTFAAQSTSTEFLKLGFDPTSEQVKGEPIVVHASTNSLFQFEVSPDGRRLAFRTGAPKEDIVVMDMDGTGRRRLTDDAFRDRGPVWTSDGAWLVFYSNRGGPYDLWRMRSDGTAARRITAATGDSDDRRVCEIGVAQPCGQI